MRNYRVEAEVVMKDGSRFSKNYFAKAGTPEEAMSLLASDKRALRTTQFFVGGAVAIAPVKAEAI